MLQITKNNPEKKKQHKEVRNKEKTVQKRTSEKKIMIGHGEYLSAIVTFNVTP